MRRVRLDTIRYTLRPRCGRPNGVRSVGVRSGRRSLAVLPLLAVTACELPRFGAPDAASSQGEEILGLWKWTFLAATGVATVVWGLIVYVLLRYRRRDDEVPRQNPYNVPVEVLYTVAPILIVAVLFAFTVRTERKVSHLTSDPDLVVEVRGFQWQWQFTYVDDGVVITGDGSGTRPELVLPVGRTVRFELVSDDVVHSFWVPDFLRKRDLIPGVDNEIDVDVERPGVYEGRCAEYCGLDHYRMSFVVRAVPADEFDDWLAEARAP